MAEKNFKKKGNNRDILVTANDGDFNVGAISDKSIKKLIIEKRKTGIFSSVLGFGNYKDSKLEILADKRNGNHAFINTMQEAQKVFGKEFGVTLHLISKDVKIQVEFNPNKVKGYRLIGDKNRVLNDEYFTENSDKIIYNQINNFILKYNSLPNKEALNIELSEAKITEEDFKESVNLINEIGKDDQEFSDLSWLLDSTEKFCQDKAIYNAVVESISILDNPKSTTDKGAIPDILSDALSVSFDPHVGHDYIDDSAERFDYYHRVEERIPFDLDYFNRITKGGLPQKTLNICLAGTGVGKSLFMCHVASSCLAQNQNVLYMLLLQLKHNIMLFHRRLHFSLSV